MTYTSTAEAVRRPGPPRWMLPLALGAAVLVAPAAVWGHSPHDVVNKVAVGRAPGGGRAIFTSLQLTSRRLFGRSFDGGATWSITALPVDERDVAGVVLSPDFETDLTAFVATADKGVLRTTDGGASWTVIDGGGLDPSTRGLAFSRTWGTDQTVLVATVSGLYASTDGGDTWVASNTGLLDVNLAVIATGPAAGGGTTWVTGGDTVHVSTDFGATWTPLHTFPTPMVSVALSPAFDADGTAVAGLRNQAGIQYTTDSGTTWLPMADGLSDLDINEVAVTADGTVFAATQKEVFRAPVGGAWEVLTGNGFEVKSGLTGNHYRAVALSPDYATDSTVIFGTYEGLFTSEDGGDVFRQSDIYHERFNRRVRFAPDGSRLFTVNYGGGVFVSPAAPLSPGPGPVPGGAGGGDTVLDPGVPGRASDSSAEPQGGGPAVPPPWEARSIGIASPFGQDLALSPAFAEDGIAYYAQKGMWRSKNAGRTWVGVPLPPELLVVRTLTLSPTFDQDQILWMAGGLDTAAWRSTDGGQTWDVITTLPDPPNGAEFAASPDFASDQTVFFASRDQGVFKSTDAGVNWSPSDTGITELDMRTIAVSPDYASDATLFAGTATQGLFRSTDGGASWAPANTGLPPDRPLSLESIAISPGFAADRTMFVAVLAAGVFRSTDGGDTWTALTAGLPLDAPRIVAVSPDFPDDGTVVVSTYNWLYRSTDGGDTFDAMPGYARIDDGDNILVYEDEVPDPLGATLDDGDGEDTCDAGDDLAERIARAVERSRSPRSACACHVTAAAASAVPRPGPGAVAATGSTAGGAPAGSSRDGAGYAGGGLDGNGWAGVLAPQAFGQGVTISQTAGDLVELDFYGDSISWWAARAPDSGSALIVVDDVPQEIVELYAPRAGPAAPVFTMTFEEPGAHRIRVTNRGVAVPEATDVYVRSDGFSFTY